MGSIKFRKKEGVRGGGFKLRRSLSIDWNVTTPSSEEDIVGTEGEYVRAITFGGARKSTIALAGTEFQYFRKNHSDTLATSNNKRIIDGPFFGPSSTTNKSIFNNLSSTNIQNLISHGAWAPDLQQEENLILRLGDLTPDTVYEIRLVMADFRNPKRKLSIAPNNICLTLGEVPNLLIGRFIAPDPIVEIKLNSDEGKPCLNAYVVRNLDYKPRSTLSEVRILDKNSSSQQIGELLPGINR
jgi:hypothetical protein